MAVLRKTLLRLSQSDWLEGQVRRRRFARRATSRFLPGEDLDAALAAAEALRANRISTVLTQLGENVTDPSEAEGVTRHYLDVLDRVRPLGLDAEISVKLTQLGLDLGVDPACAHLAALVGRAGELQNFVWIDMEGSAYTDETLEIFRRVRAEHANVGVCLQAYLRRTARDMADLLSRSVAIRLVKGAYREPPRAAYQRKKDVDASYLRLAARLVEAARGGAIRPAFATHDTRLIREIQAKAQAAGLPKDSFEFQMLYGIQREAQSRLVAEDHRVRVLISYGSAWFPWFMRRLAERPANLWFVARNVFVR